MSDEKIVPLINDKFCGTDQLDCYDASGNPGPGVTHEIANAKIKELSLKLDKREQEALADEDRYHNALARIDELEHRLELYAKAGDGSDIKMEIGDCDGIGCRDETIKILQAQVDRYRYLIERDITYDVACKDCEHGLNFSTAICPICTEAEVRKWTLLHQERRFERDKLQWKLNDITRVLDRLNKNEITNERDALAQIEQLMEQPK